MSIAYVNGVFSEQEKAQISIMDRGFLFGDGVYEVIPVYDGQLFMIEAHLKRLQHSLDSVLIKPQQNAEEISDILNQVIQRNGGGDMHVYLQFTRGSTPQRQHDIPIDAKATIVAFTLPMRKPNPEKVRQGVCAVTLDDIHWQRCDIKAITLLPNVLLNHQAITQGADTSILIKDGYAIEGTASNIFIVQKNKIVTSPLGRHILNGITRQACIELARSQGYIVEETLIPKADIYQADEIWMTSSTKEITPIIEVDKQAINGGVAGPIWEKLYQLFQEQL